MGVTARANEDATGQFYLKAVGETCAQVQGPVAVNDPIGVDLSGAGYTYLAKNTTTPSGVALQAVAAGVIQLIKVRLGTGGGGGSKMPGWWQGMWSSANVYMTGQGVALGTGTSAGVYISTIDNNTNLPDAGIGWVQAGGGGAWL
jgi:hypothetical protein